MVEWRDWWRRIEGLWSKELAVPVVLMDDAGPYKGLRPYTEADRDKFFAREADCKILIDKILANRLTLLFAASGVGKSSLLQAAMLPQLKNPRYENLDVVYYNDWITPPLTGLRRSVMETLQAQGRVDGDGLPTSLDDLPLKDFFRFCALFTRQPLVVMLDQFEEFFQYQRRGANFTPFIRQLVALITDREIPVAVIISMREDFALELNAFKPALPTLLFENFYRLEKLSKDKAREAIVAPVEQRGFRYEPRLLEQLLDDLAAREQSPHPGTPVADYGETVEPAYLQIVCSQLWNLRDESGKTLRLKTYEERGRAARMLETYVENVIGCFSPGEKKLASKAFDHLITRRGTKMAYTAEDLAQILGVDAEALGGVLERLHRSFVLRRQSRKGVLWYELYHDLFSVPIERWNHAYKASQRNWRMVIGGLAVIAIVATSTVAYDSAVNYTNYHLRLNVKRGVSDAIELYRGEAGSWDFLGLRAYIAETGYQRAQVEPDKLFTDKPIGDFNDLNLELIQLLPLVERIEAYWQGGFAEKALKELAARAISVDDVQRTYLVLDKLGTFRSVDVIRLFEKHLDSTEDANFKHLVLTTLLRVRSPIAIEVLLKATKFPEPTLRSSAAFALSEVGGERVVERLMGLLKDPDSTVRANAIQALGRLGDASAVVPLVELLKDPDSGVRSMAALSLGQLGDASAVAPLVELLKDPDRGMRSMAAYALGQLGDARAVAPLEGLFRDLDMGVRLSALEALSQLGGKRAVESLLRLLTNNQQDITRTSAAEALGRLGDARAVEPLVTLLTDPDGGVRATAVKALSQLGSERAVAPLVGLLKSPDKDIRARAAEVLGRLRGVRAVAPLMGLLKDPDNDTRARAAEVLGRLGDARAVEPMVSLLTDPDGNVRATAVKALSQLGGERAVEPLLGLLKDPDSVMRARAIEALGDLGDAPAVEALVGLLKDPDSVMRTRAVEALAKLGNARAVEPLVGLLKGPDSVMRIRAVAALGKLGDVRGVEPLVGLLTDADSAVRIRSAEALGELGDARGIESLMGLLKDPDSDVRAQAAKALDKLGDAQAVEPLVGLRKGHGKTVPARTAKAVSGLGSEQNIESLVKLLKDRRGDIRHARAAEALGKLGDERAVESLVRLLEDESREVRIESLLALSKIGGNNAQNAVDTLFHDETREPLIRRLAAVVLLAFQKRDGLPTLTALARSKRVADRLEAAEIVGSIATEPGEKLLMDLLDDENFNVRIKAIESAGRIRATAALAGLHRGLTDSNIHIQIAVVATLAEIASPNSVPILRSVVANPRIIYSARLAALTALQKIKTEDAIEGLTEALDQGRAIGLVACRFLGDLRAKQALPALLEHLTDLEKQYRLWRRIRDSGREDFGEKEAETWSKELTAAQPRAGWAFELGDAMARIDPEKTGVELLSHDLADVRYGAWMGLKSVGTVKLLEELHEKRLKSNKPLFRYAAYRAMDEILINLETTGGPDELAELRAFYAQVKDKAGLGDRVEWTIQQLEWDGRFK